MNKQIKKLAEHSGGTYKQSLGVWQFYEYELQEFANLIVQECAAVCDAYGMPDGTSPVAMLLSGAINTKFGVENDTE